MAESYGQTKDCEVINLCRYWWGHRSCGCCQECDPATPNAERRRAWAAFGRMMDGTG